MGQIPRQVLVSGLLLLGLAVGATDTAVWGPFTLDTRTPVAAEAVWGPFTLDTRTPAASIELTFATGYTFVGLPLANSGLATAADLAALAPDGRGVWRYAADSQAWQMHTPGVTGDDFALVVGGAYFVASDATGTAVMNGEWTTWPAVDLAVGYNAVCVPPASATSAAALLAAVGENCQGVWNWEAAGQRWQAYLAGFGGEDFALSPGVAVLVAVAAPVRWPVSGGE